MGSMDYDYKKIEKAVKIPKKRGNPRIGELAKERAKQEKANPSLRRKAKKTRILSNLLRDHLQKPATWLPLANDIALLLELDPEKVTVAEVLTAQMISQALVGKAPYMQEIFNRVEGKAEVEIIREDPNDVALKVCEALKAMNGLEQNEKKWEPQKN